MPCPYDRGITFSHRLSRARLCCALTATFTKASQALCVIGWRTMQSAPVVILGAGPAGLTAAYELTKADVRSTVLEASGVVGGLAQTVEYKGYRFDIGGHRFFTKVSLVEDLWREVLGDDLL